MSPSRMFLSSSFTSSMPGGTMTSTTYLPGGSIGVPSAGFGVQSVQFDVAGRPVVALTVATLGNLYMPSYGAGCTWFNMAQPSKHLNWALFGNGTPGLSHCVLPCKVWKNGLVGSWPGQLMLGMPAARPPPPNPCAQSSQHELPGPGSDQPVLPDLAGQHAVA